MVAGEMFPTGAGAGAAVVIGGSGGIGRAVCESFARAGADIAFTYRSNEQAAREVAEAIEVAGRRAMAIRLDLTDRPGSRAAIDRAAAEFGHIHTLVIAHGADISMTFTADIDPDEWDRTIGGDLTGFYNVLMPAVPHLRRRGGSVLAMTSAGLLRHPQKDILSVVPKAGVEALVRGIAREEGRHGIRANAIALGVIDTGLFKRLGERLTPQFIEAMKENTALRRFGTAEEVAELALFLCSPKAAFITGQSIALDGGYSV
jgi:NAD(P)-dependent dehydrogenase (short-subunit alcohol dehydrogenase family)